MKVVQAAYTKTTETQTAKLTLDTVTTISGSKKHTTGHGIVNFAKDAATLTMQGPTGAQVHIRKVGGVVYVKYPPQAQQAMPGKKAWLSIDLSKTKGKKEEALLGQDAPTNPSRRLSYLRGVSKVTKLGTTSIDGTETTHYEAKVDLDKVAKKVGPAQTKAIKRLQKTLGKDTLPLELWIDDQGRVRQQKVNITFKTPEGKTVTNNTTVSYSDFGTTFQVSAPPKAKSQTLQSVFEKMGQRMKGQQG